MLLSFASKVIMTLNDIKQLWSTPIKDAAETVSQQIGDLGELSVDIHNASWCPDCEREVSLLLAIDELASRGFENMTLFSYEDKTDYRQKKLAGELSITCLPTLIFYKQGEEVMRVEEDSAGQLVESLLKL
jgi:thiol-disulfide isomerase/thioredoxin